MCLLRPSYDIGYPERVSILSDPAIAAFSPMLASTIKLAEKGFEICAVDEQARGLLQTVQQVAGQLDDARALLRQRSAHFSDFEKRMFEDTFKHTEDAIYLVATIAERPRADVEISGGKLRTNTRNLYVLRDSPNIQVTLSQLLIASQALNATIVQLGSRGSSEMASSGCLTPPGSPPMLEGNPPPTYDQSVRDFFSQGRRRNMARRASALSLTNSPPVVSERVRPLSSLSAPLPPVQTMPELGLPELSGDMYHRNTSLPILHSREDPGTAPPWQRRLSYRFSPDMSIPEVISNVEQQLPESVDFAKAESLPSSFDVRRYNAARSMTALGRSIDDGRKTGRTRAESWLDSRALR